MQKLVIATGNQGKLQELQTLLQDYPFELISQKSLSISDADETGLTFVENALIKARHAAQLSGLAALADDSGLCVDVMNGGPGIYSARYAGAGAKDSTNNEKLLHDLLAFRHQPIKAQFVCVLVFLRHANDPLPIICQGIWHGEILAEKRGENGFGYDPLFWLPERGCSSAELDPTLKNQISHRGQAMAQLKAAFATL
ncbi:RdgB/HAM1 family non-canonical purine NTP pyrophosphatase [Agitococcus lubricus]|uniref:dITP/XTP pyrophosphatase n=1 Tax=Agitococcus lubricus TaxID=1077255 RepID=A0A2T5J496_9GAMM|nr:RdgB/HAM1 family non-canonical purine NTP pyrophosphatase [Agitococcus lubricus]PTQ91422.1 XTP/dITP diphosphohydrolase [Agitococcus lubricus]